MPDRTEIVASGLASLNLEGLRPSAYVLALLERWTRNGASTEDLVTAEQRVLAGRSSADASASAPRAA